MSVEGEVTDKDGGVERVDVGVCGVCGGVSWKIYTLHKNRSTHVECVTCGASYCQDGKCMPDPEEDDVSSN